MDGSIVTPHMKCDSCGKTFPVSKIDAKPSKGNFTNDELYEAAFAGKDFDRYECRSCYGPSFAEGMS